MRYLLIILYGLTLLPSLDAQPQLTEFEECDDQNLLSISEYVLLEENQVSDTIIFCAFAKFLQEGSNVGIDSLIAYVQKKGEINLLAGYFQLTKEYRTIQAHLAKRIGNDSIYMEAIYQVALASYRMGDVLEAARYNMEGKIIAIRDSQHMRHISFLYRESWINWRMLRYEDAIISMEACKLLAAKHAPDQSYLYSYHNGLGNFYKGLENYKLARFHQDSALFYAKKLKFVRALAIAKSNRAIAYSLGDTSDLTLRFGLANQALLVSQKQVDREQIAANYSLLGGLHNLANEFQTAITMYDSAFFYTQITQDKVREMHCYRGWSKAYEALGDFEKAIAAEHKEFEMYKELYGASKMSDVFDLEKTAMENVAAFDVQKVRLESELQTLSLSREKNNILIFLLALLVASLLTFFWFYRKKQKHEIASLLFKQESMNRIVELEKKALQSQMNPHFIFNSLNSIKSYIAKNEARTATRFLNKFAQLMRIILTNSGSQEVNLSTELHSLQLYIELEQFRLNKSFEFTIKNEMAHESQSIAIPPLIMQPYVENAIWHGLVPKEGLKKLELHVFSQDGRLKIAINDNGIGRENSKSRQSKTSIAHKSMGMNITQERLKLLENDSSELMVKIIDLVSPNGESMGTEVQLSLPLKIIDNE